MSHFSLLLSLFIVTLHLFDSIAATLTPPAGSQEAAALAATIEQSSDRPRDRKSFSNTLKALEVLKNFYIDRTASDDGDAAELKLEQIVKLIQVSQIRTYGCELDKLSGIRELKRLFEHPKTNVQAYLQYYQGMHAEKCFFETHNAAPSIIGLKEIEEELMQSIIQYYTMSFQHNDRISMMLSLMRVRASSAEECPTISFQSVDELIEKCDQYTSLKAYAREARCERAQRCLKVSDLQPLLLQKFLHTHLQCASETSDPNLEDTEELLHAIFFHPNWCIEDRYLAKFESLRDKHRSQVGLSKIIGINLGVYHDSCDGDYWHRPYQTLYKTRGPATMTPKEVGWLLEDLEPVFELQADDSVTRKNLRDIYKLSQVATVGGGLSLASIMNETKKINQLIEDHKLFINLVQYLRYHQGRLVERYVFGTKAHGIGSDEDGLNILKGALVYYTIDNIHPERRLTLERLIESATSECDVNSPEIIELVAQRVVNYPNLVSFVKELESRCLSSTLVGKLKSLIWQ